MRVFVAWSHWSSWQTKGSTAGIKKLDDGFFEDTKLLGAKQLHFSVSVKRWSMPQPSMYYLAIWENSPKRTEKALSNTGSVRIRRIAII